MTYEPQAGGAILFAFEGSYTPFNGGSIDFNNSRDAVLARIESGGIGISWHERNRVDGILGAGWQTRRFVTRMFASSYSAPIISDTVCKTAWNTKSPADEKIDAGWDEIADKERNIRSSWNNLDGKDKSKIVLWKKGFEIDDLIFNKYLYPPPKERSVRNRFKDNVKKDFIKRIPWIGRLPIKDLNHRTVWGPEYYHEICYRNYRPSTGTVNFDLNLPLSHVGDKLNIQFFFDKLTYDVRCSQRETSGWRDAYFYIKPNLIPEGQFARAYIMQNTAYLTRAIDRAAISSSSITVSTDWDSAYWSVKASIGSDNHLNALEPTEDGPIEIEVSINGYIWALQVDRCSSSRVFTGNSRSIDGRSLSAQFGSPSAELKSKNEPEDRTAAQLLAGEVENTGWTVPLIGEDWLVPGGVFEYQNKSPMQVIKTISDACGGMVYSDMASKVISVKPRYKVEPWKWNSTAADMIINSAMADKIDYEWDERPFINAAFVSGEQGGISAKVIREGTAGDISSTMITDRLITSTVPARRRGISTLAMSGKWSKRRISLPVFPSPGVPGVILPGTIIQFVDGIIIWKGMTTSVSVTAEWTINGLKVRQIIDVERYHGV